MGDNQGLKEDALREVADLIRRGLERGGAAEIARSERAGLPVVRLGKFITTEDVRALEAEEWPFS